MAHSASSRPIQNNPIPNPDPAPKPIVIPNQIPCLFCGGTMERTGPTFLGDCTNSISFKCTRCNAVCSHFCNHKRKISRIDHHFHFEDEEGSENG